jgi:hypothetical protein
MRFLSVSIILTLIVSSCFAQKGKQWELTSPDKNIVVTVSNQGDDFGYSVSYKKKPVLEFSPLGVVLDDADLSKSLKVSSVSSVAVVKDHYTMIQGKRKDCWYEGNERKFQLSNGKESFEVTFRVSNDGVAFRYTLAGGGSKRTVLSEISSFDLPSSSKAFVQPMSIAKTGWSKVNPCYEEFYEKGIPVGTPSPMKQGWVYPALFQVSDAWVLITEAALGKDYCGTHLSNDSPGGRYTVAFPQKEEFFPGGSVNPSFTGSLKTPWRVITIGSLATIVESTLGTDFATPSVYGTSSLSINPGHSSWSWALLKDDSTVFDVQKRFVDYAADMKWEYCLVDASWDKTIGYEKIGELSAYAKRKNVGLILWYNSAGSWNETPYTPKDALLTQESRRKEFARLSGMGIKGVKIDFFGGDGQSFIKYYIDILEDAAAYNLMVNFHGSTLPRGWHRTYPNLMSCEAIKGFEYVTFDQANADEQPSHSAMLPFTRNAFDPMDFTPLSLHEVPRINRKTSVAFELALPVIFLSGIQHFVEVPSGMARMPEFVRTYLRDLPFAWEDSKFISGFPGKDVVIARRANEVWYVAGINGENRPKNVDVNLSEFAMVKSVKLIKDDAGGKPVVTELDAGRKTVNVEMPSFGGFVLIVNTK